MTRPEQFYRFQDRTDDVLMADIVPYPDEPCIMFTTYGGHSGMCVSVILPMDQVEELVRLLKIELDSTIPEPDN